MKTLYPTILVTLLLSGCNGIQFTPTTKGGGFDKTTKVFETYLPNGIISSKETKTEYSFIQGENPKTESSLELREDGSVKVKAGTSDKVEAVIPPPADYTKYIVLVVCLLAVFGGIALKTYGTPLMGPISTRLIIYGTFGSIVSMLVGEYGSYFALTILALGVYVVLEKYHSSKPKQVPNG